MKLYFLSKAIGQSHKTRQGNDVNSITYRRLANDVMTSKKDTNDINGNKNNVMTSHFKQL